VKPLHLAIQIQIQIRVQGSFDNATQDGWNVTGLWHLSTSRASNGDYSIRYALDSTSTYETGSPTSGYLTSGNIILGKTPSVSFDYFLDNQCTVDGEGTICDYDKLVPQISTDGGKSWADVDDLGVSAGSFTNVTLDLSAYASSTVKLRFYFYTFDAIYNNYEGAYIDNITFTNAAYEPGIVVSSPSVAATTEAAPVVRTVSIAITSQPSADVSLSITSSDTSEGDVQGNSTLTFTPANWETPQTVEIVGINDTELDGDIRYTIMTEPTVSEDAAYSNLDGSDITMTNLDSGDDDLCNAVIDLGDDSFKSVELGFNFPFYGYNWDSVYISANGYLMFGNGSSSIVESAEVMITGWPRIAALYDDLNLNLGGEVSCSSTGTSATISFSNVPEVASNNQNTFDITLHDSGQIEIKYGSIAIKDGLSGISAGNLVSDLADPGSIDLSANLNQTINNLTYELFTPATSENGNENDLSNTTITYTP